MYWNYRLIRLDSDDGPVIALKEVYYNDEDKPDGFADTGELFVEINEMGKEYEKKVLVWLKKALLDAFNKPILTPEDIVGYIKAEEDDTIEYGNGGA